MRYRRAWVPGGTYFFTVTLADRSQTLLTDHIEPLRQSIRRVRTSHPSRFWQWRCCPTIYIAYGNYRKAIWITRLDGP